MEAVTFTPHPFTFKETPGAHWIASELFLMMWRLKCLSAGNGTPAVEPVAMSLYRLREICCSNLTIRVLGSLKRCMKYLLQFTVSPKEMVHYSTYNVE
jgi:hypothetical protein